MTPRAYAATQRTTPVRVAVAFAALVWILFTALLARADPAPIASPDSAATPSVAATPPLTGAPVAAPVALPAPDGAPLGGSDPAQPTAIEHAHAAVDPGAIAPAAQPAGAIAAAHDTTASSASAEPLFPSAAPSEVSPVDDDWAEAMLAEERAKREKALEGDESEPRSLAWLFVGAGLIALVGWGLSRHFKSRGGSDPATRLKHVQSLRLGARQQIALVEVADRTLVIGMNAGHIALLCELRDGAAVESRNEVIETPRRATRPASGMDFGEALGRILARSDDAEDAEAPTSVAPAAEPAPARPPTPAEETILDDTPATRLTLSSRARDERSPRTRSASGNGETNAVLDRLNSLRSRAHSAPAQVNGHGRNRYRSLN